MGFITLLGRILVVAAIASSAFNHLESPQTSIEEFQQNYQTLDSLSQQYLKYDIPIDQTNWKMAVKMFGAFEILVVLLIIVGDNLGGVLYVLSVLGQLGFLFWAKHVRGKFAQWGNHELLQLSSFLTLLGIGLILSSGRRSSK